MAYDWQTGAMEQMAGPIPLGSSLVSWNPDLTRAVVYLDSKFSSQTLYWLRKDGFEPMDLVIEDEGQSWNLKNLFPDFPEDKIPLNGNAERAVWSPDGNSIALFASSEAIGKKDFDRFYVEYKLYIMNSDKLDPKPVLDNIHFPYITKWSPDSRYIAFIGKYGATKQDGVWLYSIENDSIVNIATGKFRYVLWNPENEILFAIKCDNDQCSQILEYDLSEILKP
jgi:hypothetical protein